jgi:pyruvate,orthophosphate dikinase
MTFAFSRDDVASFLPVYLEKHVLDVDPFKQIDEDGVGGLIELAIKEGRSVKPDLKIGVCGEHGGDPASIDFCYRAGLSYVSCSPFRVPLARLAGAQAVIKNTGKNIMGGETVKAAKPATAKVKGSKKPLKGGKKMAVTTAKKTGAKKPAAKKPAAKKAVKKPAAKKAVKKPAAKKAVKKPAVKKAVKKPAAKKTAAKKSAAGKPVM